MFTLFILLVVWPFSALLGCAVFMWQLYSLTELSKGGVVLGLPDALGLSINKLFPRRKIK
ncbi:MAG: hypothetical protein MUF58_22060 [Arcicella sp.]|nr:hypothetical protein [Arcicella sp.]